MPIPLVQHSGRSPHIWKLRKEGYRELLLAKGWHMRGAYAEKSFNGHFYMQTIKEQNADYNEVLIQRKNDFWSFITHKNDSSSN